MKIERICCQQAYTIRNANATLQTKRKLRPSGISDLQEGMKSMENSKQLNILNDLDNHSGVITHLEPDILECEVKWALGSITTSKPGGGDGIPAELFPILTDNAVTLYASKSGKLSSGHRTGKVSFHSNLKE